jgi:FkbM family methyltransferase
MTQDIFRGAHPRPFNPFEEGNPGAFAVFGTGARGRKARYALERMGMRAPCFVDNNPKRQGTVIDGLPVVSPATLKAAHPDLAVLVCSFAAEEIGAQLFAMGFTQIYGDALAERPPLALLERHAPGIERAMDSLADEASRRAYAEVLRLRFYGTPMPHLSGYPLYAHPEALAATGGVVIDGGAAEGDSAELFLRQTGPGGSVHAFEPTPNTFARLSAFAASLPPGRVIPVNKALHRKNATVSFFEAYAMHHGNKVCEEGGTKVEAVALDEYVDAAGIEKLHLIKLDVEGGEMDALLGARRTIRRFTPKLQICLYHKPEDLWELPLFIRENFPEYRLFVGRHSFIHLDTVLYCAV